MQLPMCLDGVQGLAMLLQKSTLSAANPNKCQPDTAVELQRGTYPAASQLLLTGKQLGAEVSAGDDSVRLLQHAAGARWPQAQAVWRAAQQRGGVCQHTSSTSCLGHRQSNGAAVGQADRDLREHNQTAGLSLPVHLAG